MNGAIAHFRFGSGTLTVGERPRVVGTLSALDWKGQLAGDIVEVRYDRLRDRSEWLERCIGIEQRGKPVLLTARLRSEGGGWEEEDGPGRLKVYKAALDQLAAVDVELSSAICADVAEESKRRQKACIVSYHDFQWTPPVEELHRVIEQAQEHGSIVKVSTMIRSEEDLAVIKSLLQVTWKRPLCVIGMGDGWSQTRIELARLGSCLTYGYLDQPAAPGQISAAELAARLAGPLDRRT